MRWSIVVLVACAPNPKAAPSSTKPLVARIDVVRPPLAGGARPAPIVAIMTTELARSMDELAKREMPPYFASYRIVDEHYESISSDGSRLDQRKRELYTEVRVGSYERDQTGRSRFLRHTPEQLPVEDDDYAIRSKLWRTTDEAYKLAVGLFKEGNETKPDEPPDFSRADRICFLLASVDSAILKRSKRLDWPTCTLAVASVPKCELVLPA